MNKIEILIQSQCPDGIDYIQLGDIAHVSIGEFVRKDKQNAEGHYPVYNGGITNTGFYDDYNQTANKIIISARGANAGYVNIIRVPFWSGNSCYTIDVHSMDFDWMYVYFFLKETENSLLNCQQKGGIPAVSKRQVECIEIPVLPIEIQKEIVKILDMFSDYKAELKAELQARREQYEYYLNLFYGSSFDNLRVELERNKISAKTLSELGTFIRGKRFVRADVIEEGYPCIHYGDMYTYYGVKANETKTYIKEEKAAKLRFAQKGDVIIVAAGENKDDIGVGLAWFGEDLPAVHDACFIYKHSEELDPMYISYFLRTKVYHSQIRKHVAEGKICSISSDKIGTALIPIYPLSEQKRIVSILDKFEALVNDSKQGLPAQIEAVQEQYEYYRNKLLTFKRKA